jgi:hypothetical protein
MCVRWVGGHEGGGGVQQLQVGGLFELQLSNPAYVCVDRGVAKRGAT